MVEISMNGREWGYMLDSLHKVAQGSEEMQMDLNLIAAPNNIVKLYVRQYNILQVIHELENSDDVSIDVPEANRFVFDPKVLHSVVKQAKDRRISLEFDEHTFEVTIDSESFSGPTQFDLRLVQKGEFMEPVALPGLKKLGDVDRIEFLENLKMLSSISKVVEFSVQNGMFEISVSDKVQGDGKVVEDVSEQTEISSVSAHYSIRPIQDFLEKMDSDQVTVSMTEDETIRITSRSPGRTSSILRAERI